MAREFVSSLNTTGDSIVSGPVLLESFIPGSANLFPKMVTHINDAAWELWQFDGLSADGKTAVTVSFYRDTRGLKEGGFHVELNALWPDGSRWGEKLYFVESIITAQGDSPHSGSMHGVWKSIGTTISSAAFTITSDLSKAMVHFSVPGRVVGTMELHALGGARESRLPATEAAAQLGPCVYYLFPFGPATVTADLALGLADETNGTVQERKLLMRADENSRGGFVRGWSAFAWPRIMTDAYYLCGTAGPYMLQLIRIISSAADGRKPHVVARLYRDDELVCAANQVAGVQWPAEDGPTRKDTVVVEKVTNESGCLAGAFRDKNTGYTIEFRHEGAHQQKQWHFEVHHKRAWWSDYTSDQGTGKSGFIEAVIGGLDGELSFEGVGGAGQLQLP